MQSYSTVCYDELPCHTISQSNCILQRKFASEDEVGEEKPSQRREKCGGRNPSVNGYNSNKYRGFWNTLSLESTDTLSRGVWSSRLRPHPSHTRPHIQEKHPPTLPKILLYNLSKTRVAKLWWLSWSPRTLVGQTIMSFILPPAPLPSFLAHYIKPHSIMLRTSLPQTQVQWIPHTFVLLWNSSFTHRQSLNCLCTFSTEVRLSFRHLFCYSIFILYDLNTDESHIVFFIIGGNLLLQFQVKHERLFGFGPLRGRSHCMDDDRR